MEYEGELVYEVELKDRDGYPTKKTCNFPAILTEKSIKRAESYEALRSGITLTAVFETRQEDWETTRHLNNGRPAYAEKVIIDGAEYEIVRTYKTGKSMIEIVCS